MNSGGKLSKLGLLSNDGSRKRDHCPRTLMSGSASARASVTYPWSFFRFSSAFFTSGLASRARATASARDEGSARLGARQGERRSARRARQGSGTHREAFGLGDQPPENGVDQGVGELGREVGACPR